MLAQPIQSFLIVEGTPVEGPIPPKKTPKNSHQTLKATYAKPYHMHASLGPSASVAQMMDGKLTVWLHAQGVFPPRTGIAHVLGMAEEDIRTIYVDGPGCYGHNGADDAALDAALLARALPGRPISLKWSRQQENTWEPYGPSMVMQMEASLDDKGELLDWNHEVWSYPHLGRGGNEGDMSGLVASWHLAQPFTRPPLQPAMWNHVGGHRNADPIYNFPNSRIVKHTSVDSPLRVSALRSLGAYGNIFAIEAFMDELAYAAGVDPVEFRLKYLDDRRGRDVLQAAVEKAGWEAFKADIKDGYGQGVAFSQYKNHASYAAVVVRLHVSRQTGEIQMQDVVIAGDSGQIINSDGLSNQLEGGFMQAASMTLKEEVKFSNDKITSVDWETYPILTFPEAPRIETVLINRPGAPFLGSGEGTQGPAPAAIANAVFDAVGIRLREVPFTPDKVLAALAEKGN
jgi:CO/xanthine dehydrogenase Mo-binding subunit